MLRPKSFFFSIVAHFIIANTSLVNVQTNYYNNPLILDLKQLNEIMKLCFFYTLKALWDGQGKIKMYYGTSRLKKRLSGKSSIIQENTHLVGQGFKMAPNKVSCFFSQYCRIFMTSKISRKNSWTIFIFVMNKDFRERNQV